MPKMKTKSSAKKRFKLTGSGKIKNKACFQKSYSNKKIKKKKVSIDTFNISTQK